jgi:hypothetical protein
MEDSEGHYRPDVLLDKPKYRMPIFSGVGLLAILLSFSIFAYGQFRDTQTLDKVKQLQQQQVEFNRARSPAVRAALCNLFIATVEFPGSPAGAPRIPPDAPERKIMEQNIKALDCPKAIVELPPEVPKAP